MLNLIISFLFGVILSACLTYIILHKKSLKQQEELIKLKALSKSFEDFKSIIKQDFVELANKTIKEEQADLRKQNKEALEEKLLPFAKDLSEFKQKIENFHLLEEKNSSKLSAQLTQLEQNNQTIQQEAENLVKALTKNQNIKGAYGEDLIDTVLQSCGMQENVHYFKQFITTSENLKDNKEHNIRPDIVINLPDNRHLIIDSKVTLTSYLNYIEDSTKLKDFKTEVKKRILDLANKNYQEAENLYQPDFILMYMPIETSVSLLYEDMEIINLAYKSNIIIVSTASLIATIRLVNQLMAQQKQCESVNQIVNAGQKLYETFTKFCEELIELQKGFESIDKKFNTIINRFKRGNSNNPSLFSQVEELKQYGINTQKEIPSILLENVSDKIEEEIEV